MRTEGILTPVPRIASIFPRSGTSGSMARRTSTVPEWASWEGDLDARPGRRSDLTVLLCFLTSLEMKFPKELVTRGLVVKPQQAHRDVSQLNFEPRTERRSPTPLINGGHDRREPAQEFLIRTKRDIFLTRRIERSSSTQQRPDYDLCNMAREGLIHEDGAG